MIKKPRNKTISLSDEQKKELESKLLILHAGKKKSPQNLINNISFGDCFKFRENIPDKSVDLLFLDPPYNLTKNFGGKKFCKMSTDCYEEYIENIILAFLPKLKNTASIYICGDWLSSVSIYNAAKKHFIVRNRITWEREKGRGSKLNWKNNCEDIWFATVSDKYTFNIEDIKLRKKVLAPYKDEKGNPKDWEKTAKGVYRFTHPSNVWTDITIPFWSMSENTPHPTQKSEKLLAKIIIASTNQGDVILAPFLGSGTAAVAAAKLGRNLSASRK